MRRIKFMMESVRYGLMLWCLITCSYETGVAQDKRPLASPYINENKDSLNFFKEESKPRRNGLSNIFADSTQLTTSDYQQQIENTYVILNNIDNASELGLSITNIKESLKDDDSVLTVLKDNILNNSAALNIRNLQVFKTLLENLQHDLEEHKEVLDSTESELTTLRGNMRKLMMDTVLKQLMTDTALRRDFEAQLKDLRTAWRASRGKLRKSTFIINRLQIHTSSNFITSVQLLEKVNSLLTTSAARILGKERNYLWEKDSTWNKPDASQSFDKVYSGEKKALRYYFKDSGNKRLLLLLIGVLSFFWIYGNIRLVRRENRLADLDKLKFNYLPSGFVVSAFIIMFALAPLFDLYAPSAYIETMQFLLMVVLTVIFWKKWSRKLFLYWVVLVVLYGCFSFTHHITDPGFWQRLLLIVLNTGAFALGMRFLFRMKGQHLYMSGFLKFAIILHNLLHLLAILCNIAGRFSLAQILGNTAIFSFVQAIGLAVFGRICIEAMLLQIIASRVKRKIKGDFEYRRVLKSFYPLIFFLVILLWLIVFTTNLNIYPYLLNTLQDFLHTRRNIGSASFTLGGILLFFFIIWIAHLLQRYVGYFFGDFDDDDEINDKGQRSRLLIAKLMLLCLGYLLAVAASGVPVDKITIVLGALGVGIGLGLQNIVNNFVSGIVLIFDRPLQIGDVVEIGGKTGRVREIGLRSSTLLTQEGAEVIIPNGDILSQQIVNWTLTNSQCRLEMAFSLKGSMDREIISATIKKAISTSMYVSQSREPQLLFNGLREEGIAVNAFFWISAVSRAEEAKSEVLILVYEALKAINVEIV